RPPRSDAARPNGNAAWTRNGFESGTLHRFRNARRSMPVWLDILLNLSGYAGFVAIATRAPASADGSRDES
uniref:hypothetical protein n=1 Tax=Acinetobacter baumannii TaxID=470 RepID=UPI001C088C0B